MLFESDPVKTIAVAGAVGGATDNNGTKASVGSAIVNRLLETKVKVIVLVRASSASLPRVTELRTKGAQIALVDYSDPLSVESALQGVDIVVSALAGGGLGLQTVLADAGKAAGVKLFVPSEFGMDSTKLTQDSPMYKKREVQLYLDNIGLPYVKFFSGLFADWISLFLKVNTGQVEIVGSDDPLIDFTSIGDVASFVTHALTTIPISDLAGQTFRLSGSRTSLIKLIPYIEKKQSSAGPKLRVVRVSVDDSLSRFKAKGDFLSLVKAKWAMGDGLLGTDEQVGESRKAFSGWDPVSVETFI